MATEIARQMGKFLAENSPKGTKISVAELRYRGLLSGSDFLITTGDNPVRHPLYDSMGQSDYLKVLRNGNPVNVYTNNQNTQQQTVINDYGYQKGDGTIAFTSYNPTLQANPVHPTTVTVDKTPMAKGSTTRSTATAGVFDKMVATSTGLEVRINTTRSASVLTVGMLASMEATSSGWDGVVRLPATGYKDRKSVV